MKNNLAYVELKGYSPVFPQGLDCGRLDLAHRHLGHPPSVLPLDGAREADRRGRLVVAVGLRVHHQHLTLQKKRAGVRYRGTCSR